MKKIDKRKIAGLLAACMVSTMLPPAMPAYAKNGNPVGHNQPAKITFDSGLGPAPVWLDASDQEITVFGSGAQQIERNGEKDSLNGVTGFPIFGSTQSWDYQGILKADMTAYPPYLAGTRPELPGFTGVTWPGYQFDGWFAEENGIGTELGKMPYAFADYDEVTFFAHWTGDTSIVKPFTVIHERLLPNGTRVTLNQTSSNEHAAKAITAKPKRSGIPGYQFVDNNPANYKVEPEFLPKYGGTASTKRTGTFSVSNSSFSGTMPNDATTITYQYEPNTAKFFTLRTEYVDEHGSPVKAAGKYLYHAEQAVSVPAPPSVTGYAYQSGTADFAAGHIASGAAYSTATAGTSINADGSVSGYMPNQNVTVKYVYNRTSYDVPVTVTYTDNLGNAIDTDLYDPGAFPPTQNWSPGAPVGGFYELEVAVPDLSTSGFSSTYSPSATFNGSTISATPIAGDKVKVLVPNLPTGTDQIKVNVRYQRDAAQWATVTVESGPNGTISGDTSPKSFFIGSTGETYDLNDLVGGISLHAATNYQPREENGNSPWYIVNGSSLTQAGDTINLTGNLRLRACFEKDPDRWFDVTFTAGNHGSISPISVQNVSSGTLFSAIAKPQENADPGYVFQGWFDGSMNLATGSYAITGDVNFKAIFFSPNPDPDYSILVRPDAHGGIASDGTGEITINDMHEERSYAVTDENGKIIAIIPGGGSSTSTGTVGGLNPSSEYKVYELDPGITAPGGTPPAINSNIGDVADPLKSFPTSVTIPAVGDNNTAVQPDPGNAGKTEIVINPVAPSTEYAILDEEGNVVMYPDSDGDGWRTPGGNEIIFNNLDPNKNYTIVTKETGNTAKPEDKENQGSIIFTDNDNQQSAFYVVQTINGRINTVGSDPVNDGIYQNAQKDQPVFVEADLFDADGNSFLRWEVITNNVTAAPIPYNELFDFTMPAGHVILVAVYDVPQVGTKSNADVEFKVVGGEGTVALNTSAELIEQLRYDLTAPEDDDVLATPGRSVLYQIRFEKRAPFASESNAVKAERSAPEESYKGAWAIDVRLKRFVDTDPREVPEDADPGTFEVFASIDAGFLGNEEYELWEIFKDPNGDTAVRQITDWLPDPNSTPENRGVFMFKANVDAVYVLCYSEVVQVKIKNTKTGRVDVFPIYRNTSLSDDTDGYVIWKDNLPEIRDAEGVPWILKGLSTSETAWTEYDETKAVKKDLMLYAHYEKDPAWLTARKDLEEKIKEAEALKNTNLSEEDKNRLEQAIGDSQNVINNSPTQQQLEEELKKLQDVINSITGGGGDNPDPGPGPGPGPKPPTDNGGSSGGSGRKITAPTSKYPTYRVGVDGNWELIDEENHKWLFVLNSGSRVSGTWAYLSYTFEGQTRTECYHFAADGVMDSGWFRNDDGTWYYLSPEHDGWFGRMVTGWHHDQADGRWYYLDPASGAMWTGWGQIGGKWYYFNPTAPARTWTYNEETKRWEYLGNEQYRPYGSMYASETTPDGYRVDENGAWVQ